MLVHRCRFRLNLWVACTCSLIASAVFVDRNALADDRAQTETDNVLSTRLLPLVRQHCVDCHGADDPDGGLDLTGFESADDVAQQFGTWDLIRHRVADGEMPPAEAGSDLDVSDRQAMVSWIDDTRDFHARKHAGDPGDVLARRLSAAEYNYTIRDLTGVDLRPASQFPIDPTNEAGFDNSGESLMMTPSLLDKYIEAARTVSDHLVFAPDGLQFAPHPVVTETDRDKYCVRRIVDFYQNQNTNLADYFDAALRMRHAGVDRQVLKQELIVRDRLSERYLDTVSQWLADSDAHVGPIVTLIHRIHSARESDGSVDRSAIDSVVDDLWQLRKKLTFDFPFLQVDGINRGSQPLVLWRNRQKASHRMTLNGDALRGVLADSKSSEENEPGESSHASDPIDERTVNAFETFCRIFPDRFYVDRRGREYVNRGRDDDFNRESEYRLLSAGFHSMMGYFRDDEPLVELMLTDAQKATLDRLWFQLNFIADVPRRQHSGFIWFERAEGRYLVDAEFDEFQAADKDLTDASKIMRLRDAYLEKAQRLDASREAIDAMKEHFTRIQTAIRGVEEVKGAAREKQLAALLELTERAYRRPLRSTERAETLAFYQRLVQDDGLSHEDAVRDVLVSVLMSPHFCFRLQPSTAIEPIHRLDSFSLANRISYLLWSSMPDDRLMEAAQSGVLATDEGVRDQVTRMLRDPKVRGFAVEFGGNWLGFRQFESHNGVDRTRFPQFDDGLREAMFEEPVRFVIDVLQRGRPVSDFLYATDTFVNNTLAKHYGMNAEDFASGDEWRHVERADRYGRGGILPMAVFLTKNSPGLRTSPVKRGYWVVRDLLGTHIPAPPPNVPDLPEDESKLGELTLRELLAKHREHPSCSGCHEKFDSFGLVFEGFGPIGEWRQLDLGGNPIDNTADFPDGVDRSGVEGLKTYLRSGRERQFVDTLCRKLFAFALGRTLVLSDEPFLQDLVDDVCENESTFEEVLVSIVLSDQFRNQRGINFGVVATNTNE